MRSLPSAGRDSSNYVPFGVFSFGVYSHFLEGWLFHGVLFVVRFKQCCSHVVEAQDLQKQLCSSSVCLVFILLFAFK